MQTMSSALGVTMKVKHAFNVFLSKCVLRRLQPAAWHKVLLKYSGIIRWIVDKGERVESDLHKILLIPIVIFLVSNAQSHARSPLPEWLSDGLEIVSILATLVLLTASVILKIIRKLADPVIDKDRERGFPAPEQAVKLEKLFSKEDIFDDCPAEAESLPDFLAAWAALGVEAFAFHSPLDIETRYTVYEQYARNPRGVALLRPPSSYGQKAGQTESRGAKINLSKTYIGFVCTFPVSPRQFAELREGNLSPYELVPVVLPDENSECGPPDQPVILYVQSIYLRTRARKALTVNPQHGYQWIARIALVRSMLKVLQGCDRPLYLFALAASDKGGAMLEHLGFTRTSQAWTGTAGYWIYELDTRLVAPPQTPAGIKTSAAIARLRALSA